MKFRLRILPAADCDVDEAAAYIARDSIRHAMRLYDALATTYETLLKAPRHWPVYGLTHPRLADIRKRTIIGFPNYLIFYRIDADFVEIVRVLHGSRDVPTVLDAT